MSTSTTNYNFTKDDPTEYYDISRVNANLDLIDAQIKANETAIDELEEKSTFIETTLSNHSSIFLSGTGTDSSNAAQNFNSIVEGQSNVKISGFTTQNLVQNGNFSNGTTSWDFVNSTCTVTNSVANVTPSARWGNISKYISTIASHLYYCTCSLNSDTNVSLQFGNNSAYNTSNSTNNISLLSMATSTTTCIQITDSKTSNWTTFHVQNVMCIDLTLSFGSGKEPTLEECNKIFDHYIDGVQGVSSGAIVSVGKNYINPLDYIYTANNTEISFIDLNTLKANAKTSFYYAESPYKLKVKPLTTYTFKANQQIITSTYPRCVTIMCFDKYGNLLKEESNINTLLSGYVSITFTTQQSCSYLMLRFSCADMSEIFDVRYSEIQLEEGSTATDYRPYQSSRLITTLSESLYRLPDGTQDVIDEVNGIKTLLKNTAMVTLNGSESWQLYSVGTNVVWASLVISNMVLGTSNPNRSCIISQSILNNKVASVTYDLEGYGFGDVSARLYVAIAKSRLSSADVTGFRAWLTSNPITVVYQLNTPLIYTSSTSNFTQTGNIEVYPNGNIYQIGNTAIEYSNANLDITYNLSDNAVMMSNSAEISSKIGKDSIVNNCVTTVEGTVLDGRTGKKLQDNINIINARLNGFNSLSKGSFGATTYTEQAKLLYAEIPDYSNFSLIFTNGSVFSMFGQRYTNTYGTFMLMSYALSAPIYFTLANGTWTIKTFTVS